MFFNNMNILLYTHITYYHLMRNLSVPGINIFIIDKNDITKDSISNIIEKNQINLIIPLHYQQMKHILELKEQIPENIQTICSNNYSIIEIFMNKINFIEFMINNKLDTYIPKVYWTNKKNYNDVISPFIFKIAMAATGEGSFICHNCSYINAIQRIHKGKDYIIQEYISGNEEYAFHSYIDHGKIKWWRCYKLTNDSDFFIQKGHMKSYEKVGNIDYSVFETIFSIVDYVGFACIDFKIKDNVIKIFEINPRFGGSLLRNQDDMHDLIKFIGTYYCSK